MNRTTGWIGALLIGAVQALSPVAAQDFPTKQPIKLIVPVPAGGTTDAIGRITAEFLQRRLGQTVIVENRPGASSTIGTDQVFRSPADGYTILLSGAEFAVVPAVRSLPYRFDQFTFLMRPFTIAPLVIASPKASFTNMPELLAQMKAKPGELKYGSTGIGAIVHIGITMLEGAAGVKGLHVPYNGIAPVFNDLMGGTLDFSQSTLPFPDTLKVLASVGAKRSPAFPNVPTLQEFGVSGATWDVWFGFFAPPSLPKPVADRLTAELAAVFKDPEAIAKFQSTIKVAPDLEPLVGDAFRNLVLDDNKRWKTVVEREKIVVQ
jgi:tripartite-type tricarboxylate transporter receptor subunit TctC